MAGLLSSGKEALVKDEYKAIAPRLPPIAYKIASVYGAWVVGGACLESNPKDVDLMVPLNQWYLAAPLVPASARPTVFGGWKWVEGDITVDCWPDSLSRLVTRIRFQAAYSPSTGTMLIPQTILPAKRRKQ